MYALYTIIVFMRVIHIQYTCVGNPPYICLKWLSNPSEISMYPHFKYVITFYFTNNFLLLGCITGKIFYRLWIFILWFWGWTSYFSWYCLCLINLVKLQTINYKIDFPCLGWDANGPYTIYTNMGKNPFNYLAWECWSKF